MFASTPTIARTEDRIVAGVPPRREASDRQLPRRQPGWRVRQGRLAQHQRLPALEQVADVGGAVAGEKVSVAGHDRQRRRDDRQLVPGAVQVLFIGDDRLAEVVRLVFEGGDDVGVSQLYSEYNAVMEGRGDDGVPDIKTLQDLIDQEFAKPSGEPRGSLSRLGDLTKRGIQTPATLTLDEVQQISFALSVLLSEEKL